ncbi:MAG TPA: hypothetical protein VMG10_07005 [Gemmataceae bacterium]|nr:hypothetical protein [Gemmataceae bacterium]
MKEAHLTLPELALIAGTRAVAGAGIGLLLANRLSESQRRAVGWTLLLVGAISTVPLALEVFGKRQALPPVSTDQIGAAPTPESGERMDRASALAQT